MGSEKNDLSGICLYFFRTGQNSKPLHLSMGSGWCQTHHFFCKFVCIFFSTMTVLKKYPSTFLLGWLRNQSVRFFWKRINYFWKVEWTLEKQKTRGKTCLKQVSPLCPKFLITKVKASFTFVFEIIENKSMPSVNRGILLGSLPNMDTSVCELFFEKIRTQMWNLLYLIK